jgi:glycine/D-amino acid oxidase-like deaminating enzyme
MATRSPWQQPLLPASCDVAVVGGGVMGAATAFWLHRLDPAQHVVLLEAEVLAHGASGRNAGFLLLGTHTDYASAVAGYGRERARRLWQFTAENVRLLREELDGAAFDLTLSGSLTAAGSPEEAERLRRSAELLAEDGAEAVFLDADAANARMQAVGFEGALFVPDGGTQHPARLVRHLVAESGAVVLEHTPVTALAPDGDGMQVTTDAGVLRADRVVLTLNAYLPHLLPETAALVRPVRAQMLATEPVAPFLNVPVYSHDGFFYLRQQPDGRLLLGGARHLHETEEFGYEDRTTSVLQADLEAYLHRYFPNAGRPSVERRWSGTMGFSPDSLPFIGRVPDMPEVTFTAGFTGHGMGFCARFGLLMARRVLGLPDEAADLFAAERLFANPV